MLRNGNGDIITLLLSVLLGAALCIFYDVFRIIRIAFRSRTVSIFFQDIFYFTVAAVFTFFMLLVRTAGEIRWFVLAGEVIGFIICRFSVSQILMSVSGVIINSIKWAIAFVNKIIIMPIKQLLKFIITYILKFSLILYKKILKMLKYILKLMRNVLYNVKRYKKDTIKE